MEKKIIVRYNAGPEVYRELVNGNKYEVTSVFNVGWKIKYSLNGFNGSYDSRWFEVVELEEINFMAFASNVPKVGECFECFILEKNTNGLIEQNKWLVEHVNEVSRLGRNIYRVTTNNNIFVVQVN